jgi:N-acylneuraminate cytidylyltransferase/CMP-N,N'-diacetyllegionaminic acid synthase
VILSSDSDEIIGYCANQGIEVPFRRPDHLAADDMPMLPVIKHAVEYLHSTEGYVPAYIVLLQPTSPLRNTRHIDDAIKLLIGSDADSVVSVVEVPHCFNPYSVMCLSEGYLESFLPYDENMNLRQKKPEFYARNGAAICAFTYECLSEKDSIYGDRTSPYMMKEEESIDIDGPFDMRIAEFLLAERP